jgi:hypothetical protein
MPRLSVVLAFLVFTAVPASTYAHYVGVECKIRGDLVEVEAYYDDGTEASKAKVRVVNSEEKEVGAGLTDDKGKWSFATPAPGKYTVHLDAGAGHRATTNLVISTATADAKAPNETISEGPTREEFTRTPWLKLAIGLIVIFGLSGAFLLATWMKKK